MILCFFLRHRIQCDCGRECALLYQSSGSPRSYFPIAPIHVFEKSGQEIQKVAME